MRILVVGAGGVGSAIAAIAQHRSFYDHMTVADIDPARAARAVDRLAEPDRFSSSRVDASDQAAVRDLVRATRADVVVNATDPRFNLPIFRAAFDARCMYLDLAMSLSEPHPDRPYSEPELFEFPDGIGVIECVNVEHEEVVLVPREIDCRRVTFKYGLGAEFIDVLQTLHKLGLDSKERVRVGGAEVAPRDVVAAVLPDPATLGDRMTGKTCAGTFVSGTGRDGAPRSVFLYHVADNERTMREYGHQAVVLQTAINPVAALELLAAGTWQGTGVLGPESFPADPFLELLADYGEPHGVVEGDPRRG